MSHWRDGGIGNMAGSDDRPGSEFTLMEKLAVLGGYADAGKTSFNIACVAQEAFEQIEKLRERADGDRLDKLEAMVTDLTDLFRQLRSIRESRNDGLATLNKGIDDLRQRIEGKFAKADEEHALDVVATDARMDRLSGILNEHERRLDNVEKARAWIDTFEVKQLADATDARMDRLERRLTRLRFEKAMSDGCDGGKPNPTITGGWVNVYRNSNGALSVGILHSTKEGAVRHRTELNMQGCIACVRIPDFTEGEGL